VRAVLLSILSCRWSTAWLLCSDDTPVPVRRAPWQEEPPYKVQKTEASWVSSLRQLHNAMCQSTSRSDLGHSGEGTSEAQEPLYWQCNLPAIYNGSMADLAAQWPDCPMVQVPSPDILGPQIA